MNKSFEKLARVIEASSTSSAAKEWLHHIRKQIEHWPPEAAFHLTLSPSVDNSPVPEGEAKPWLIGYTSGLEWPGQYLMHTPVVPRHQSAAFSAQTAGRIDYIQFSLERTTQDLQGIRSDIRERVRRAFLMAVVFASAGGLAFFVGLGLWLGGLLAAGVPSGIGGVISSFVGALFYKFYWGESEALEAVVSDLRLAEEAKVGLWLASHITDPNQRDKTIADITVRLADRYGNQPAESTA